MRKSKWIEPGASGNWPVGWGYRNRTRGKSAISSQNRHFGPDIDPILSLWRSQQACTGRGLVADIGPLGRPLVAADSYPSTCCRSSVVEHSIGNGEVDSSILSGSTSYLTGCVDFTENSVLSATQVCHTDQWFP